MFGVMVELLYKKENSRVARVQGQCTHFFYSLVGIAIQNVSKPIQAYAYFDYKFDIDISFIM